ncbi:MAG TPA: molybdopterin cofactor-binding domain-containing protein, partial [Ktedonobacteraceae bacterium]|nr:molybdopterin cofactor-binding domain-containing protein [Ktedonobacteraceae bacterium]
MELELRINGVIESLDAAPNESLQTLLRREGYCSVKHGCETGECGACTVLVEGVPRPSCVMLAAQAGGCELMTVEGLGVASKLHPLQEAFIEVGAVQCGFCTPGMLLSAYALLKRNPSPTKDDVRDALSGNLCRCGGYEKPVQAVLRAAAVMRGEKVEALKYNTINPAQEQEVEHGKLLPVLASSAVASTVKLAAVKVSPETPTTTISRDQQFQVIGKPLSPLNSVKLATGKPAFANDINLRDMLHARILPSPHAHAVIRTIDISEAKALPGVHAVLTHKDVPRVAYSSVESTPSTTALQDRYCLDYILRYVGDRVAVVVAENPDVAEQALKLIKVDYEVLPAVLHPRHALEPNAPRLHPERESSGIFDYTRNVAAHIRADFGDVEDGFVQADLVVEGEYFVSPSQQVPLENHTVLTYFDENNCLVVRTNCQAPHYVRRALARILGLPARRIRVISTETSKSAGGRQELLLEDLCALLTTVTRRPVTLAYTRAEEFASSVYTPHILRMKTGVLRDGTIIANQMILLAGTGAYGTHPLITQRNTLVPALSLYPCPHLRFGAEVVYTNHAPAGVFCGTSLLQEFFALESHMDEIANRLGMDALALRRKNWIKIGDTYRLAQDSGQGRQDKPRVESCGLPACLQIVEDKLNWAGKRKHAATKQGRFRRGIGVALAMQENPGGQANISGALVKLNEDGSFDLFVGATDSGSGVTTMIAQIAAEVLGVPLTDILVHTSETDFTPFASSTDAATAFYASSGATRKAGEQMRRQILAVAGRMLNILPEALKISNGLISGPNGQHVSIEQVAAYALYNDGRQLMTTASWKVQQTPATFAVQGVEVEVDTETGNVRVLNVITAVDVGRAINPLIIEGQIHGSVAQALGATLSEELLYDQKGALLTANLSDYRIYAAPDMPEMQV